MIRPDFLKRGDKIGLVATGKKVSPTDLEMACRLLEGWGLEVVTGPNLYNNDHSYLASTDANRRSDLQAMIDAPEIKAILCARGGYGTTRIIDEIDVSPLHRNPKWIVGFSDITAIHLRLFQSGIESIHGTMPLLFSSPTAEPSIESLRALLFGSEVPIMAPANKLNKTGQAEGQIIGGNLSLIVASLATKDDVDLRGKILVVEEIEEYRYKIDRMFMQLKRSDQLNNLAGLVIGHMTNLLECTPPFGEAVEDMVLSKVGEFNFPVAFDFPIGHEDPNLAWRHGSHVKLSVTKHGSSLQPLAGPVTDLS